MACFFCGTHQPVAQTCIHCSKQMARYFCGICKFFDDTEGKQIFHCDKCNICRVGDSSKYIHCDQCGMCLLPHDTHRKGSYEGTCPICGEDIFNSISRIVIPGPCSHALHHKCLSKYLNHSFRCPLCLKTYSVVDMSREWKACEEFLKDHPMPEEYRGWRADVCSNLPTLPSLVCPLCCFVIPFCTCDHMLGLNLFERIIVKVESLFVIVIITGMRVCPVRVYRPCFLCLPPFPLCC
eukprot:TRINITY_DN9077_c0_g2_i13.p1 TRINITY_DN9077_c0_g2~~TRINITY_DN9077_c0_g2_i13.p1  ORF type:complete len:237 (-),score=13.50 TRINITY_DN9077_c0_g2_i13:332-1042(-)